MPPSPYFLGAEWGVDTFKSGNSELINLGVAGMGAANKKKNYENR